MSSTPEHVLWAIAHPCELRDLRDWADPAQTERQLRPLRAYRDALLADRVFEQVCLDQATAARLQAAGAKGFPISEISDAFGDSDFLNTTCGGCTANTLSAEQYPWAGCHGWFASARVKPLLNHLVDGLAVRDRQPFACLELHRFRQGFYALWAESVWQGTRLARSAELFRRVAGEVHDEGALRFAEALRAAEQHGEAVRVRLLPPGSVAGRRWLVAAHCPTCTAPWVEQDDRCTACDYQGRPVPERKRYARGNRPFIELTRFMGSQRVVEFMGRYRAHVLANQAVRAADRSVS